MPNKFDNSEKSIENEKKSALSTKRRFWVIWLVLLFLSAYIVPYVFIGEIGKITASFLFWTFFAIAAIFSTVRIIRNWRD